MTLLGSAPGMAFMMKKKKYKFEVDLNLEEMIEVPFLNAVLFAKIRLLDGGFQEISNRDEVKDHTVKWGQHFLFPCKMSANASTGELDPCMLRISIRKEIKGGRSYQKLGYADFNLASFAGQGLKSKKTILKGYDTQHRQDNSMLLVTIKMHMLSGDILFKVPSSKVSQLPSEEDLDRDHNALLPASQPPTSTLVTNSNAVNPTVIASVTATARQVTTNSKDDASIASSIGSTGCGSLTKKSKTQVTSSSDYQPSIEDPQSISIITDSGISDVNEPPQISTSSDRLSSIATLNGNQNLNAQSQQQQQQQQQQNISEMGHSRNSSNTSQMSKGSGYSSSVSEKQHSRQSSDGDNSGHTRYTRGTFQKAESLSSWYESQSRDRMNHQRRKSHSLKLKIIQHNKDLISCKSPESPTNEMYRTPNTTLEMDDDDSGFDIFCTPSADISLMKMKSMNNLHDVMLLNGNVTNGGSLARMKSLGHLNGDNIFVVDGVVGGGQGDTQIDLVRLKRNFETKKLNMCDDDGFDEVDGFSSRRHHSDNGDCPPPKNDIGRLSLQTPKKRVGITKYVGADSQDESQSYQLMKMHSMCTITDIVNNNMRAYDGIWKENGANGKKYDKRFIVPIRLDDKYFETKGSHLDSNNDDVFKMPQAKKNLTTTSSVSMNPLRKEKSSSCIESMKNRGSTLYDRLRNSLHRRLLDGSPRMSTLNATSPPNDSSHNLSADVNLHASINGENFSTTLSLMPSGTSSLVLRRPSANMNPSGGSIPSDTGSLDRMKAQAERRKKVYEDNPTITGRVENTRVNPDKTIDELFATHKLEQLKEDTEARGGGGLKLVIGRDGKASLGSHETSQQRAFKHVVGMDSSR